MSDIKINGNVIWGCLRREFASPACFLFNYVHVKGLYFDEYLKEYPNSAFDRDSASAIFREMWSYLKKCFPLQFYFVYSQDYLFFLSLHSLFYHILP